MTFVAIAILVAGTIEPIAFRFGNLGNHKENRAEWEVHGIEVENY